VQAGKWGHDQSTPYIYVCIYVPRSKRATFFFSFVILGVFDDAYILGAYLFFCRFFLEFLLGLCPLEENKKKRKEKHFLLSLSLSLSLLQFLQSFCNCSLQLIGKKISSKLRSEREYFHQRIEFDDEEGLTDTQDNGTLDASPSQARNYYEPTH
jgi:hypothetical protein